MSYVRAGEGGSQVYVYDDIDDGLRCCGCALADEAWGSKAFGTDADALLAHLDEHAAAGHVVPSFVADRVRADYPTAAGSPTTECGER